MSFASQRNSSWIDPDVVSDCVDCPSGVCDAVPIGTIAAFGGVNLPAGWMMCNGSSLSSTTFPDLYKAIGTTWGGIGDNFKVPDLRGCALVGAGQAPLLSNRILGKYFGEELHALTSGETAPHAHGTYSVPGFYPIGGGTQDVMMYTGTTAGGTITDLGFVQGYGHNNMQPSAVVNWMIKYSFFEGYVNPFDGSGVIGLTGTYP